MTAAENRVAVYLGDQCHPNMVAHLDARAAAGDELDVLVASTNTIPSWLQDQHTEQVYPEPERSGAGLIRTAASIVDSYLTEHDADRVEQVFWPHWHALGVLWGARGHDVTVATRLHASARDEWRSSETSVRPFIVNNVIARAALLGDEIVTPTTDAIAPPWAAGPIVEEPVRTNTSRFDPTVDADDSVWSQPNRRVVTVGRVTKKKGIDLLLEAADRLPRHEFVIAGPQRDAGLVQEAREQSNVSLLGERPYREMPSLYAGADVLLSASRQEWGGVSRAMLEADAMDVPVVALDKGQAATVAESVVEPDDDAIAQAIVRLTDSNLTSRSVAADGGDV